MFIEDLKIKHLSAFIGNEIGKSVYILNLYIDPDTYFDLDENGKRVEGTDTQYATVTLKERGHFDDEPITVFIEWSIDSEEIISYDIEEREKKEPLVLNFPHACVRS